jgi:putative hydrolase of the HAD superfamily
MEPIQAVIFDLGRVLVNVDVERLMEFFCKEAGRRDAFRMLPRIMADPLMAQYSTGQIDSRRFHRVLCGQYGLTLSFDEFALRWCDIFSPMEGMEDIVAALSQKVKLGLLSDTDPLHWEHIKSHYPMMRYFPRPTLSFQVGVTKPNPSIYVEAAKHAGVTPVECFFVDDLADNVRGARAAGMTAIQFQGVGRLCEELTKIGLLSRA